MSAWHSPKRKRYKGSHQDLGDAMVELTKVVALAMNTAPPTESDLDRQLNEAKIGMEGACTKRLETAKTSTMQAVLGEV